ncbi:MAG: cytochrome c nitrite reductase small subunit [Bacteroidales bacterium]|nr:cytochrome c nitrite reductase small subunit [Bacteroidales bacterium]
MLKALIPPDKWRVPVLFLAGIFAGLSIFVFHISKAPSYLSDNPSTCVNCHVMAPQYSTWAHSSHREIAVCNDCHVPHNNVVNKYFFKMKDGLRHATVFTLRKEPQVIFIKESGADVVQNNCIRCHNSLLTDSKVMTLTKLYHIHRTGRKCWECHRETPHGRVNSLSSVPYAKAPLPESPVPEWINDLMNAK